MDYCRQALPRWRYLGFLEGASAEPPATLDAAYQGQLDDLPADARHVAEVAAVPGGPFTPAAVAALGGSTDALDVLTRTGLLRRQPCETRGDCCYLFRHALLRDAAYQSLTRAERGRLHRRYADWLAQAEGEEHLEQIAVHLQASYEQTPVLARTEEMATKAADALDAAAASAASSAPRQAADLYTRALGLTPASHWEARITRYLGLGEAHRRSGRLDDALDALATAGARAQQAHWAEMLAEAAIRHEDALFASRLPRREAGTPNRSLLLAALEHLPAVPSARRACVEAALARADFYAGDGDAAVARAHSALSTARSVEDPASEAAAHYAVRLTSSDPQELRDRIRTTQALITAAHRARDAELELEGHRHLAVDYLQAGHLAEARAAMDQAETLIEELRLPLYQWYPAMWRGMLALLAGDNDRAARRVEEFHREGQRWGYRDSNLVYAAQLVHLEIERQTPERAIDTSRDAQQTAGRRWLPIQGYLAQHCGDAPTVHKALEEFKASTLDDSPGDLSTPYALALATDMALWCGDTETAVDLAERLAPWRGQSIVLGSGALCLGATDTYVGAVALHHGDTQRAVGLLTGAADLNRALHAGPALKRTCRDLTAALGVRQGDSC